MVPNALAAGATQEQLNQITSEAQTVAEDDPIDPDDGDGGDSVLRAAIWGWKEGEVQGTLNSINGVQDILIGMGNFGSQTSPAGIIGSLFGFDPITFESPDWSNGAITTEDPTLHDWSKCLGGNGIVGLASMFPFQVFVNPTTLYHFTSTTAESSIAASGTI